MAKTKPIGVRFDKELLESTKLTPQSALKTYEDCYRSKDLPIIEPVQSEKTDEKQSKKSKQEKVISGILEDSGHNNLMKKEFKKIIVTGDSPKEHNVSDYLASRQKLKNGNK